MKNKKILAVPLVAAGLLLTGCGYNIPSDMIAVHEQKGPFQARKVVDCQDPSTRSLLGNDKYALFPTSEREWDATGQKGSDGATFKSVTKDNVEMSIPVTVRFSLITECNTLKKFYTRYARRYGVAFSDDGSYNSQWIDVLRKLVKDPADTTLDRIVQDYNWRDVWNNAATKTEIEKRFSEALRDKNSLLVQTAHDQYFDGISVLVGKASPPSNLRAAVATEQENVAKANSARLQADADVAKAQAQVKVARAEAEKRRATVSGYGSPDNYLKALAIQQGQNPFQPQYIIPSAK